MWSLAQTYIPFTYWSNSLAYALLFYNAIFIWIFIIICCSEVSRHLSWYFKYWANFPSVFPLSYWYMFYWASLQVYVVIVLNAILIRNFICYLSIWSLSCTETDMTIFQKIWIWYVRKGHTYEFQLFWAWKESIKPAMISLTWA